MLKKKFRAEAAPWGGEWGFRAKAKKGSSSLSSGLSPLGSTSKAAPGEHHTAIISSWQPNQSDQLAAGRPLTALVRAQPQLQQSIVVFGRVRHLFIPKFTTV